MVTFHSMLAANQNHLMNPAVPQAPGFFHATGLAITRKSAQLEEII